MLNKNSYYKINKKILINIYSMKNKAVKMAQKIYNTSKIKNYNRINKIYLQKIMKVSKIMKLKHKVKIQRNKKL